VSDVNAAPGVVLAVWTGSNFAERMIRVEEALRGKPAVANHVIIVTHQDSLGRWMGIQGQPGGVGQVDCTPSLTDSRTRGNYDQVMAMATADGADWPAQLNTFLGSCAKSLGLAYDWVGIAEDACDALHLSDLREVIDPIWKWRAKDSKLLPGHVVCSSLAAALYEISSWPHPDMADDRTVDPAAWWQWSDQELWQAV
jgi:hypothetical protein